MNHCSVTRSDQTEGTTDALPVENVKPVTIELLKGPNKEPSIIDVDSFAFALENTLKMTKTSAGSSFMQGACPNLSERKIAKYLLPFCSSRHNYFAMGPHDAQRRHVAFVTELPWTATRRV
jgi:hypothetical protein